MLRQSNPAQHTSDTQTAVLQISCFYTEKWAGGTNAHREGRTRSLQIVIATYLSLKSLTLWPIELGGQMLTLMLNPSPQQLEQRFLIDEIIP